MKEVGSVLVEFSEKFKINKLFVITETDGNIYINSKRIPTTYNVEESIRWFLDILKDLYIHTLDFQTSPLRFQFTKYNFLQSWWEDYAVAKTIVTATVRVSKTDYESDYDSV